MTCFREFRSPISPLELHSLGDSIERVQLAGPITAEDWAGLRPLLDARPDVWLRVFSRDAASPVDLEFLRILQGVRRLWIDTPPAQALGARELASLPTSIEALVLPHADKPAMDLAQLAQLGGLTDLTLAGSVKSFACVGALPLRRLSLSRVKARPLDGLHEHPTLETLIVERSVMPSLDVIAGIPRLSELQLLGVRRVDPNPLPRCRMLERLEIVATDLECELPSLAGLDRLRFLRLESVGCPIDLAKMWAAPCLEALLIEGRVRVPRDFSPPASLRRFLVETDTATFATLRTMFAERLERSRERMPFGAYRRDVIR